MGILNSYSKWRESRHEQRMIDMAGKGLCPDCHGLGINTFGLNDYSYYGYYNCPGCNGTGQYSEWINTNQPEG